MNSEAYSQKPFGQISSSIGPLSLFEITAANETALYKELGRRIDQCGPEEYVHRLARYVCFPGSQLSKHTARPAGPAFTMSEIEDLSETDLEVFSTLYVQNHPSLYRKFESERIQDKDGSAVISWKLGDVLYPKKDDESFTRYLHRLAGRKQARELEQAEKEAAQKKLLAAAQAPPDRPEEINTSGDSARPFSRALLWFGAVVILMSICSIAISLHALSLVRYSTTANQPQSPSDITLNINFELSRIAELLNNLQEARATATAVSAVPEEKPSAEPAVPPEKTESKKKPPVKRRSDNQPPPDTKQIFEQLRHDC